MKLLIVSLLCAAVGFFIGLHIGQGESDDEVKRLSEDLKKSSDKLRETINKEKSNG